ncbi:MAG: hypothetical protein ACE5HV_12345 [Acidobacteriota bacterium]
MLAAVAAVLTSAPAAGAARTLPAGSDHDLSGSERLLRAACVAQDLRRRVRFGNFRFVGIYGGPAPAQLIGNSDGALLAACRHASTLDQVLSLGVPFRSQQLRQLLGAGLLEQRGVQFHTTFPILLDDEAEAFRPALRHALPAISVDLFPAFERLHEALASIGMQATFPVIATWVIRERGWHHLLSDGGVNLPDVIESQRRSHPDRGWWGALWYIDPPGVAAHEVLSVRGQGKTAQVCWASGHAPEELAGERGRTLLGQFLALIDGKGRRLRNPERFSQLQGTGLIDSQGALVAPVLDWVPGLMGTPAAAVEEAACSVAEAFTTHLPLQRLASLLGIDEKAVVATIAYAELAPDLLRAIDVGGLGVLLAAPTGGAVLGDDGSGRGDGGRPVVSAAVWEGLPAGEPAFFLPW